jgi:hypothetical protein
MMPSFEKLYDIFLSKEMHKKEKNQKDSKDVSLWSKTKKSGKKWQKRKGEKPSQPFNGGESSSSRRNLSKIKCFNYNRKGHFARDYPKRKFEGEKGHDQHHGKDQSKSHQGNYVDGVDEFLK